MVYKKIKREFERIILNCAHQITKNKLKYTAGENVVISKEALIEAGAEIGEYSYIGQGSFIGINTVIGKYCSISRNVTITPSQHPINFLSTHPFQYQDFFVPVKEYSKFDNSLPSKIGNDVWIGTNVVVMDGIEIGNGAVIGANSVVTKDIPPYAIAVGSPAKVIKYRFSEDIINKLQELQWWDLNPNLLGNLPFHNINECIKLLESSKNKGF